MGYPISHSTVHQYLRDKIGAKSYKRPRLTEKMKEKRLKFAESRKDGLLKIGNRYCGLMKHLFNCSIRQTDRTTGYGLEIHITLNLVFK